jgi:hypothetical protein
MSGYRGGDDAKPNGVIVRREGGPAPGKFGGDGLGRAGYRSKIVAHLMFEVTPDGPNITRF